MIAIDGENHDTRTNSVGYGKTTVKDAIHISAEYLALSISRALAQAGCNLRQRSLALNGYRKVG